MKNRAFKGLWIPLEMLNRNFTPAQLKIIADASCFNEYHKSRAEISEVAEISVMRVSIELKRLRDAGVLIEVGHIFNRKIYTLSDEYKQIYEKSRKKHKDEIDKHTLPNGKVDDYELYQKVNTTLPKGKDDVYQKVKSNLPKGKVHREYNKEDNREDNLEYTPPTPPRGVSIGCGEQNSNCNNFKNLKIENSKVENSWNEVMENKNVSIENFENESVGNKQPGTNKSSTGNGKRKKQESRRDKVPSATPEELEEVKPLLETIQRLTNKKRVTLGDGFLDNFRYWRKKYSIQDMVKATECVMKYGTDWWKQNFCFAYLVRKFDSKNNPVDRIRDFQNLEPIVKNEIGEEETRFFQPLKDAVKRYYLQDINLTLSYLEVFRYWLKLHSPEEMAEAVGYAKEKSNQGVNYWDVFELNKFFQTKKKDGSSIDPIGDLLSLRKVDPLAGLTPQQQEEEYIKQKIRDYGYDFIKTEKDGRQKVYSLEGDELTWQWFEDKYPDLGNGDDESEKEIYNQQTEEVLDKEQVPQEIWKMFGLD